MTDSVFIDRRFCGPPSSANGGYACGVVAKYVDGPAEVTLRAPPALDKALRIEKHAGRVRLLDGDVLVAEGAPADVKVDAPEPVSLEQARAASARFPWRDNHVFPTCFVCGPRSADGLRIFPGPVEGSALFAADWTPDPSLADADGFVRTEFVWAALDCPSGVVAMWDRGPGFMALLGRLAVEPRSKVRAGVPHVVTAWNTGRSGRKMHAGSALFTANGERCAAARSTWIELSRP